MDKTFDRGEILVIKACKSHFGIGGGYNHARAIIQHIIYAFPHHNFEQFYTVLTKILRKSRDWTVEGWADLQNRAIFKAREDNFFTTGRLIVDDAREFEKNLIDFYCAEVAQLRVFEPVGKGEGNWYEIINLNITDEEERKAREAIQKYEQSNTNIGA